MSTTQHGESPRTQVPRRRRFVRSREGAATWEPLDPAGLTAPVAGLGGAITEGAATDAADLREGLYRRTLALVDAAAAALLVVLLLPVLDPDATSLAVLAAVPLLILVNKVAGLYERDDLVLNKTTLDEAPALLQTAGLYTLMLWLLLVGAAGASPGATGIVVLWGATFAAMLGGRAAGRRLARLAASSERCLVVGEAESIRVVSGKIAAGRVKAEVVAALDLGERPLLPGELTSRFRALVQRCDVHRAIIALPPGASGEFLDVIRIAKHAGVRVSVVPRLLEVVGSAVEFDHLDGLTMLSVRRFGLTRSSRALKRGFDFVGASLALLALAPLMAAIAIAVRLDSRGPVFFCQTRVGRQGACFGMLKFRSMVDGAEAQKDALRHLNERDGLFKIERDPRITRVGRFLRRSSLDELPQLFNVWRGEMSLVGPRPLVVDEDAQVLGLDRQRLHLTPGMTGPWQVLGSARIPMHEMVGIDYLYVANWSLWTDVKILLRTIPHVLASRGM